MIENLLDSSAPVIQVDGQVQADLGRDVRRLDVEETTHGLKTLVVSLVGHGPKEGQEQETQLYLDGSVFDFGRSIKVSVGPGGNAFTVFDGVISAIEVSLIGDEKPELTVFAEDKLMKLRMTRRMKTYEHVSDADLASVIAGEHGLESEVDADGPTYDVVQQWNISDLAFLRERASLINAELWADGDTLYFKSRNKRAGTDIGLSRNNELINLTVRADLAHQRTSVQVSGYDADARQKITEEATSSVINEEISGGRTGVSVLHNAFGDRISYRAKEAPLNDREARDFARAEILRRARAFVKAVGVTRGTPNMVVGSKLSFDGSAAVFDGAGYYATRVRHTYDVANGLRTHFEAERPTLQEGV